VVPASLIHVTQKAGGIAAGAFREDGELVGFVYGMAALRNGGLTHWSHMLGVAQSHRGQGIGKRLKYFQRDCLLDRGVSEMRWTFDPLVAGNASFNLNVLRVRIDEYVRDMYGGTGSDLHSFGTDRLVAHWRLHSQAPSRDGKGTDPVDWKSTAMLNSNVCPAERLSLLFRDEAPEAVRIPVPRDIFAVIQRDPSTGMEWRHATRTAFLAAWERGYRIVGFSRPPQGGVCHYHLRLHSDL
jgi:chorismate synthase